MTCYPQLLANFVYKSPPLAGLPLLQKITFGARFFAARDLVIAQVFCRRCVTPSTYHCRAGCSRRDFIFLEQPR